MFFIYPCLDEFKKVDLRTTAFDVPPQEVSHIVIEFPPSTRGMLYCYRVITLYKRQVTLL